jgi:hypothetical protein
MEVDMSKALSITAWMKRGGLLLIASSIVLTGCQGFRLTYKGAKVLETYRIAIADGTQRSARYQSSELTIDYNVVRNGDELQLSGVAEYTSMIKNGYPVISYLNLGVFLTDQDGNILQDNGIKTPGSEDPNYRIRFYEKIQLPPGTANMAFRYSIDASVFGCSRMSSCSEVPIVR